MSKDILSDAVLATLTDVQRHELVARLLPKLNLLPGGWEQESVSSRAKSEIGDAMKPLDASRQRCVDDQWRRHLAEEAWKIMLTDPRYWGQSSRPLAHVAVNHADTLIEALTKPPVR